MFFLLGSSLANLAFPKLLGDLVNAGNEGTVAAEMTRIGILLIVLLVDSICFFIFQDSTFF